MKIDIITTNAKSLEDKIFKSVGDPLETWEIRHSKDNERRFLTPVANQYIDVVILELKANDKNDKLTVYPLHWSSREKPSDAVMAIVLGMFTATLLTHFNSDFIKLETK